LAPSLAITPSTIQFEDIFHILLDDFQTVLNQLSSSPQSDSFMADEAEGSGEGSGTGRGSNSGWDDDDDNADYSSGEGSGENPITTQVPNADDAQCKYRFFFTIPYTHVRHFLSRLLLLRNKL